MKLFKLFFALALLCPTMALAQKAELLTPAQLIEELSPSDENYRQFSLKFDHKAHTIFLDDFLNKRMQKNVVVIDLRSKDSYLREHIEGAKYIGPDIVEKNLQDLVPSKDTTILLYCENSLRPSRMISSIHVALPQISYLGYKNVYALDPIWRNNIDYESDLVKIPMSTALAGAE